MEWEDRSRRVKKKRIRNIKTEEVRMTTQEDKDMKLKKKKTSSNSTYKYIFCVAPVINS